MRRAGIFPLALVALLFSASACSVRYERSAPRVGPSTSGYPMICNDPALRGEVVGEVPGGITGCGIANAVRLHEVNGVQLSSGAVVDCPTARAFGSWVDRGLMAAVGNKGGGVQSIRVAASYACRTRNHQPGARISEHGRGKAIDVSGYRLRDGTDVTVLRDWGTGRNGRALKQMHRAACGTFGTVLGPDSDRFHQDHFHFDTARHRGGPYCR
ncbi:extensin family protein [Seohaeicola saemankumensis]|uniref:Extensin family protein n=1 Tax=Seohaeicola saemankumensis TaxID=481181 RepID=A0ABW3TEG9_9RHOB